MTLKKKFVRLTYFIFFFLLQFKAYANLPQPSQLESGYLPVTHQDNLFYLLARSKNPSAPLVIYVSGGPGVSSMVPAVVMNGPWSLEQPFHFDKTFQLKKNPWTWNNIANVVYLDQPRYEGYSYGSGDYLTSLEAVGHDFLSTLQQLYQRFPEFSHKPLYLTGESFAGAYLAEFSHQILQYNKTHLKNNIPLAGLFIQSAVTQANYANKNLYVLNVPPIYQFHFLCTQHLLPASACLPNQPNNLRHRLDQCIANVVAHHKNIQPNQVRISDMDAAMKFSTACKYYREQTRLVYNRVPFKVPESSPKPLRGTIIQLPSTPEEFSKNSLTRQFLNYSPNPFNVSLPCRATDVAWCYDNRKINQFFNKAAVKNWLGFGKIPDYVQWKFQKPEIRIALLSLNSSFPPITSYYVEALKNHIKVIFAYGKHDGKTNYFSAQFVANQIAEQAYGKTLFANLPASPTDLKALNIAQGSQQQHAGEYQTLGNLTFAEIDHAGHLVAMDQPQAIYKLFNLLLKNN